MKFGYLELSDMETQQHRTLEEVQDAVRQLQRMAGLRQTGVFDRDTEELMYKPRCGVQDTSAQALMRSAGPESFTLNDGQWPNTDVTYRYDMYTYSIAACFSRRFPGLLRPAQQVLVLRGRCMGGRA